MCAAASSLLPQGWEEVSGARGIFYWCHATGERSWKRPLPLPPGWVAMKDDKQAVYVNTHTRVMQTTRPVASAITFSKAVVRKTVRSGKTDA